MRDLREVLLEVRPSLAAENHGTVLALAHLVWVPQVGLRRHAADPSFSYFPARELEALFGRARFNNLNERHRIFEVLETQDCPERWSRGYRLVLDVKKAVSAYLRRIDERLPVLIARDGNQFLTPLRPLASKNSAGNIPKCWSNVPIVNAVPVSLEGMMSYAAHLERYRATGGRIVAGTLQRFSEDELARIELRCHVLDRLIGLCNSNLGRRTYIPHRFEEKECGRLYATGHVNLQTAPSDVKAAALQGCWEYDLSNCHFTALEQLAARQGMRLAEVRWYLENKGAVRESLAQRIGTTNMDAVKHALIAGPIYGAPSTLSPRGSIRQMLGRDCAKRLFADLQYRALRDDVKKARAALLRSMRIETVRGVQYVVNEAGGRMPRLHTEQLRRSRSRLPAELLSHLLLGVEVACVRPVFEAYPDDVVLPMHDGFVSRQRLDPRALERLIRERTGFSVALEEKQIEAPIDAPVGILPDVREGRRTPNPINELMTA